MKDSNSMSKKEEIEVIKPLVDELLRFFSLPNNEQKKKMWAEHQALSRNTKTPIWVYYEGIPYTHWKLMFGDNFPKSESDLGKNIEFDLKKRFWMERNVPDDYIAFY